MIYTVFKTIRIPLSLVLFCGLVFTACERDLDELEPAQFSNNPIVFEDAFSGGLDYSAFAGSKVTAFDVDNDVVFDGDASMRFSVPDQGDPEGGFAGGAFIAAGGRDLSEYNALTFYARASEAVNVGEIGYGNYLGGNEYVTTAFGLALNSNWQKYYLPIPDPSRLTSEQGLLYFSASPIDGRGYTFWMDEVKFENVSTLTGLTGRIENGLTNEQRTFNGVNLIVSDLSTSVNLPTGVDQRVLHNANWFDFFSSDESVATVDDQGRVAVVGAGTAEITATFGGVQAEGALIVNSLGDFNNAPTPTEDPSDVIAIFSDQYNNVPVDFYNGFWEPFQTTLSADFNVNGDNVLNYTNFNFVGTQFSNPTVDASNMTHMHFDLFYPNEIAPGTSLMITIRDFGADGSDGGGDDRDQVFTINGSNMISGQWNPIDIELNIDNRTNMGLIIYEGTNLDNFYADNIYFYNASNAASQPTTAAPTPTREANSVLSIYSDAYADVSSDTYLTVWSMAQLDEIQVAGDNVLNYSSLDFAGIETVGANLLDATAMTHVHIDIWSPNMTQFRLKLVDFGPDGGFDGGDDVEHEIVEDGFAQGEWVSLDIPLTDFVNLTARNRLAQYILAAQPAGSGNLFIDNFYFYSE